MPRRQTTPRTSVSSSILRATTLSNNAMFDVLPEISLSKLDLLSEATWSSAETRRQGVSLPKEEHITSTTTIHGVFCPLYSRRSYRCSPPVTKSSANMVFYKTTIRPSQCCFCRPPTSSEGMTSKKDTQISSNSSLHRPQPLRQLIRHYLLQ
jgi:hypothetical protein